MNAVAGGAHRQPTKAGGADKQGRYKLGRSARGGREMGPAETLSERAHDVPVPEHRANPEAKRTREPDPERRILDTSMPK